MVDFSETLGVSSDLLIARFKFLSTRAEWHLAQLDSSKRAASHTPALLMSFAATLQRDAGAIALIQGEVETARQQFLAAGELRLKLGFFDGLFLLRLGGADDEDVQTWLGRVSIWFWNMRGTDGLRSDGFPPLASAASRSPAQLVSVLQASNAENPMAPELAISSARGAAAERLKVYSSYLLGVTQTAVEPYVDLLNELESGDLGGGRNTLIGISAKREELLTAARRDTYHWRLALKPADLVDMDLLALGLKALEHGEAFFQTLMSTVSDFGALARVPFEAARLLKRPMRRQISPDSFPR